MKPTIDISNISSEEFVEHMRELDKKSQCPCVRCEKCQVHMQRHRCVDYQKWVHRYVVKGLEEDVNIVYAFTADYAPKAFPSMRSLKEHNPKAKVFVVTEADELDLPIEAEIINIKDQTWFPPTGVNYHNQFTYINLLKVCYASILPCNKVIHLDADTIICDSIEELWKTDVKGKWFAACPEYKGRYKPFGDMYYNMGVALINLSQIRKDNIEEKMVEYLNTVKQPYADQDAWNIYALQEDKAVAIPIRFNECFATGETDNPAIVHYCGYISWYEAKDLPRRKYLNKYL